MPDEYLITKHGAYYRPKAQGYTTCLGEAGRFTLEEAIKHSHPNGPDGPRDGIRYEKAPPTMPNDRSMTIADELKALNIAVSNAIEANNGLLLQTVAELGAVTRAHMPGILAALLASEARDGEVERGRDGPQALPTRYTCEGCQHFRKQWWKEYLDNDETDSGWSADCSAANRSLGTYWSTNQSPPDWCPRAAMKGNDDE